MSATSKGEDAGWLKLRAVSAEDVEILSTLLQDAIIPGEDMTHDRAGRRFVMVVNRFCWDRPPLSDVKSDAGAPVYERRLCGIQFHGVDRVRAAGMPPSRRGMLFNLLAITATGSANATQLELLFSDNVSLRLDVDSLLILAEDLGDGHPTTNLPSHIDGS